MKAYLLKAIQGVTDAFWSLPAVIILLLSGLAVAVADIRQLDALPAWLPQDWIYGGGDTGARTLLGAIASSTIGVAGTLFSITIAALTLASSQMGPRLLRNFIRDRGNQVTLGVLLGTFAYALILLRSVRGGESPAFVPALGVTLGLALAGACIALLVYFIHHVASRINVDTVIALVHAELETGLARLTLDSAPAAPPDPIDWSRAPTVCLPVSGYLQQVDTAALADWADQNDCVIHLLRRPGEFVFPNTAIARISKHVAGAEVAVRHRIALSPQAGAPADLTFPVAQLVEIAVRALSPGINDPRTAVSVLNRLGAALAILTQRHLDTDVITRDGVARLRVRPLLYAEITDVMFDMIRENAGAAPSVLIHMLGVLAEVARIETDPERRESLRRHALRAHAQGQALFVNPADLDRLAVAKADLQASLGG